MTISRQRKSCLLQTRRCKTPPGKYIGVTILQLIASGLVNFVVDEVTGCGYCTLSLNDTVPSHMQNVTWDDMYLIDDIIK